MGWEEMWRCGKWGGGGGRGKKGRGVVVWRLEVEVEGCKVDEVKRGTQRVGWRCKVEKRGSCWTWRVEGEMEGGGGGKWRVGMPGQVVSESCSAGQGACFPSITETKSAMASTVIHCAAWQSLYLPCTAPLPLPLALLWMWGAGLWQSPPHPHEGSPGHSPAPYPLAHVQPTCAAKTPQSGCPPPPHQICSGIRQNVVYNPVHKCNGFVLQGLPLLSTVPPENARSPNLPDL